MKQGNREANSELSQPDESSRENVLDLREIGQAAPVWRMSQGLLNHSANARDAQLQQDIGKNEKFVSLAGRSEEGAELRPYQYSMLDCRAKRKMAIRRVRTTPRRAE